MKNWTKNRFSTGPPSISIDSSLFDEIPPAVLAAKRAVGLAVDDGRDAQPGAATPLVEKVRIAPLVCGGASENFSFSANMLVLHSGETLSRMRSDAPWAPAAGNEKRLRGSQNLAVEIASCKRKRAEANQAYEALVYAPGSNLAKNSLFLTWVKICQAKPEAPLPLTEGMIRENAAILRSAGYRAVKSFLYEAKDRHLRAGHQWSSTLDVALQDAKRVAERAKGQAVKSDEVRPEFWQRMVNDVGWDPDSDNKEDGAPACGVHAWIVGTLFVLREVELASLTLGDDCVQLHERSQTVTLKLPVSKNDPSGRGAIRSLGCVCGNGRNVLCAYHTVSDSARRQLSFLNMSRDEANGYASLPLFGQQTDPKAFVDKRFMVREAQRHVQLLAEMFEEFQVQPSDVTGHFMRRSGIKDMARRGCTFTSIQWFARHTSTVTWNYIEEAWGECPEHSLRLKDELALAESLASTLGRMTSLEEAVADQARTIEKSLRQDGVYSNTDEMLHEIRKEARRAVQPKFVINSVSKVVHIPSPMFSFRDNPKLWSTVCGWSWVNADGACRPVFEDDELCENLKKCLKCFQT